MHRREFLKLGVVAGGKVLLGGTGRFGTLVAAPNEIPRVDRLVLTSLGDNVYDIFAKGGKIGNVTVTRNTLPFPYGSDAMLLSEHGLAYHLQSFRGDEEKQILLDFALTPRTLANNYQGLRVDPSNADALIISHGHVDHYGGLLDLARSLQGRAKPGLTVRRRTRYILPPLGCAAGREKARLRRAQAGSVGNPGVEDRACGGTDCSGRSRDHLRSHSENHRF